MLPVSVYCAPHPSFLAISSLLLLKILIISEFPNHPRLTHACPQDSILLDIPIVMHVVNSKL